MAAKYSPEERRKRMSASAHAQMTAFWAGCTGETHLQMEWARILGINQTTISERLAAGKSVEEALTKGRLPQAPRRKI